jgi:hypothetical protein
VYKLAYVLRIGYKSDQTDFYAVNNEYSYHAANKATSINVTSLQDFDSLHLAGSTLNDYFINGPGADSRTEDVISDFADTKEFFPTHDPDDLWLMIPPALPGSFKFVVEMDFDNGVIVRDTTAAIIFRQ